MKSCNNRFLLGLTVSLLFIVLLPIFYIYFLPPDSSSKADITMATTSMNFRQEFLTDVGIAFGPQGAKVVIEEFYSVDCGACQHFHSIIKQIKEEYIDKGKSVRLIKVDFPLGISSMQAVVIARSSNDPDKYLQYMDYLLEHPEEWIASTNVTEKLHEIADRFFKFSVDVVQNKKKMYSDVADYIYDIKDNFIGNRTIKYLPTLFINGKMYDGPGDYLSLKGEIDKLLVVRR